MQITQFLRRNKDQRTLSPHELGDYGERLAIDYLQKAKYRIVATNYLAPLGRGRKGNPLSGEVDIIAYDPKGSLRFIEVKTRSREGYATPQSAVDLRKQRQIIRASWVYRRVFQLTEEPCGFDVIAIIANNDSAPKLEMLPDYFSYETFSRSRWSKRY